MFVSEILQQLRNTTKRNEKTAILESLSGEEKALFQRVATLTYSPHVNFWIKDIDYPETTTNDDKNLFEDQGATSNLDNALDVLEHEVSKRGVTGHKARDLIIETYQSLQDDEKDAFRCVVDRDLKSGVSVKSINKVWPDLIYDHPYMRGSSFSKKNLAKINFPCLSQTKEDGEYEDIIISDSSIEQRARSGAIHNEYLSTGVVQALRTIEHDVVLMGEIIAFEDATRQKLMNRQKSNGYLNSNEVDPERLLHVIWDVVPHSDFQKGICAIPYDDRMKALKRVTDSLRQHTDQIRIIDSRMVNSVEEVIAHFKENVEGGLEGVMVKNREMVWKDGTSKDSVKVKIEFHCDLKITGFNQGKTLGEWDEKVGSIICESSEGKLQVNVGTGLTDEQRIEIWQNQAEYMGKISTVKSNDVIANDLKPDKMCLFLPRITTLVRQDKTDADSYERVIEQKDAFVDTLKAIETL